MLFLNKDWTMDNVQKINNCATVFEAEQITNNGLTSGQLFYAVLFLAHNQTQIVTNIFY
jgi:hypothetical protein